MSQNTAAATARQTEIAEALLTEAARAGADAADALVSASESLSVSARDGALEEAERSESLDFGLRVLIGQRQACVSASDASPATVTTLAERAVAMAREAPEDAQAGLADPALHATDIPDLDLVDPAPSPSAEALLDQALALESAARGVAGVAQVEEGSASYGRGHTVFMTSTGFSGSYGASRYGLGISAIAGEGLEMERDYAFAMARFAEDLRGAEELGIEAGERAVKTLSPRRAKAGRYPILFDSRVADGLVSAIVGAANGASVARGSSFLRDKMGETILAAGLDILDDPHRPRGLGSRPFDGEGLPTRAKKIVQDGVLREWLLDLASARKLGLESNGSASRGIGSPPSPGSSNVWLPAGGKSPEELTREAGEGLLVTMVMGRGVNPVTGDYSRGARGFWFEGGEIAYPVSELTIAGHILEMTGSMIPADDLRFEGRINAPSVLVEGMTIASQ